MLHDPPTIGCPHCRKRFVWKQDMAGKVVRCMCSRTFMIPGQPELPGGLGQGGDAPSSDGGVEARDFDQPAHEELPDDADLQVHCPSCNLPMKASALVCLNCGYNVRDGAKVKTRVLDPMVQPTLSRSLTGTPVVSASKGTETGPALGAAGASSDATGISPHVLSRRPTGVAQALRRREDDRRDSPFIDIYLPVIFIIAGIVLYAHLASLDDMSFAAAARNIALYLVIVVPLLLCTLFLAARILDANYGSLGIGLLKLTGLAMGPMALADVIGAYILGATLGAGFIFESFLRIVIVGVPLSKMFDLDIGETLFTLVFIIAIRIFFEFVVLGILLSMI